MYPWTLVTYKASIVQVQAELVNNFKIVFDFSIIWDWLLE